MSEPPTYQKVISDMRRIVILGGPRSGKTTLGRLVSEAAGHRLLSTDADQHNLTWDELPTEYLRKLQALDRQKESYVLEGIQAARVLREGGMGSVWWPDLAIWLEPEFPPPKEHRAMLQMCRNAWADWLPHRGPAKFLAATLSELLLEEEGRT